jgi:hypothetical protein
MKSAENRAMELTRFSGHLDTWDPSPSKRPTVPRKFTPEYPPEFRADAVRLVREGGRKISVAAKDLGVSGESLRHWSSKTASTAVRARTV